MQLNEETALDKLAELGMEDMPVMEYTPTKCILDKDWFKQYTILRKNFLTSLMDSIEDIVFMNLPQDEYINLVTGQSIPENLSIRFRIPLVWGGPLSIENLFMCYTFPYSHNLDLFILNQNDASKVYLPNPAKKIYIPTTVGGGGDGGNATSDRLSQIAAMLATSRGNE
ncbi:MAG: hypothetical protein MJ156_00800 [Alphaproteobacteria bacterium]|nr:hypothetical protein [Alphaproteobacteria bacterium]